MDRELLIVLIWLAAAISLLVLIQVAVLGVLFLTLYGLFSKLREAERKLRQSGVDFYELSARAHRLLGYLESAVHESAEMGHSLNQGIAEARLRLARVEQSVSNLIEDAGETMGRVQHAVAEPGIQFRAVAAAIRAGVDALGRGFRDSTGDQNR